VATVTFADASRVYPGSDHPAVDKLTLEIGDGELLVLMGPSGCGKTTTLRMIAGHETVSEGDILAVMCTGAYNYAMASNYNRFPKPAVVAVTGGQVRGRLLQRAQALCSRASRLPHHQWASYAGGRPSL